MNNKGFSFIESLISLFIIFLIVSLFGNFKIYMRNIEIKTETNLVLYKIINNEIMQVYEEEWSSLNNERYEISIENNLVIVEYKNYMNLKEKNIEILEVVFYLENEINSNNIKKEYKIERSIYK